MFYYNSWWEVQGGVKPKMPPTLVLLKKWQKNVYGSFSLGLTFTREGLHIGLESNKCNMSDCKIHLGFKMKSFF